MGYRRMSLGAFRQAALVGAVLTLLTMSSAGAVSPQTPWTPLLYIADRTAGIPTPPAGKVALRLSFAYQPAELPGAGLEVDEPTPSGATLWAMQSLAKGEPIPVEKPVTNNVLFLQPGELHLVTLVYRNPTPATVGFVALAHQESPGSFQSGTRLTCFCLGFVYTAPAEGAWYRVIRVGVASNTPAGAKIDALWAILTDPKTFPMGLKLAPQRASWNELNALERAKGHRSNSEPADTP